MEELLKEILEQIKKPKCIEPTGIYTVQDLADYLECDYGTALKWLHKGLRHRKIGRTNYIIGKNIISFFEDENDIEYTESSKTRIERKLRAVKYN